MKKYFYLGLALCMGFTLTSCDDDEDEVTSVVTQEKTVTVDFEGSSWDALIDDPQYNGTLLYGSNATDYAWEDAASGLTGGLTLAWGGSYGYSEGGTAISNYIDNNLTEHASYTYQLAVPRSNGSQNFAVVYCDATIKFKDGAKHVIKSMDISPTTYQLGVTANGDGYAKALTENGDYLTIVMTVDATDEEPNGTATYEVDLARDGNILTSWKRIDLSRLGAVNSLTFTIVGSDNSDWGVKQPKYFAFDNVVVKMD